MVVPLFNEAESVAALWSELRLLMDQRARAGETYEVVFVSDGSFDATVPVLRDAIGDDPRVTLIEFMRNFGQSAATAAGFDAARGSVIVPIDGDGQNDPADIPQVVAALDLDDQGRPHPGRWDVVSGWRKQRQDKFLSRRFPSVIANRLIKRLTWTTEIHDFGCSLKAYRRQVLDGVVLYGEMHRFLPAICKWQGARITETVVGHRPRTAGSSKYGLKRTFKVLLDLLTVKFLGDYLTKPIYFFGKVAAVMLLACGAALGLAVVQKLGWWTEHGSPVNLNDNIFLFAGMLTFLLSVIFLMMGVLAELMVRIYHEAQGRPPYKIRRVYRSATATATADTDTAGVADETRLDPPAVAVTRRAG